VTTLAAAVVCFAGFGWGMVWHFRRIGPPTKTMLCVALAALVSAGLNLTALGRKPFWHPTAALALYAAGAGLFWWAVSVSRGKLAACGQGCVSREILSTGPYRYIRHPFYAAYNLTWLAGFVATGRWPLALSAAGMAALYESCARDEERAFLRAPMGAAYRVYSARAGRYLPRFTRAFGPGI
jgi:protein-S-isoprenylcysteine O-methyltransferase Ste14